MPRGASVALLSHHALIEFFKSILKVRFRYSMGMLENMYKDLYTPPNTPL